MTDTIKLRDGSVEWREIDGELVALDTGGSKYLAGNRTATALWPRLAVGATREELLAVLLERFDVGEARAARDLDTFLADLDARGLLDS